MPAESGRATQHQNTAEHGAHKNGDESAKLEKGIAGDQLVAAQILRQDAVFDRAEEGRSGAGEKQHGQVQEGIFLPQAPRADDHYAQFEQLDPARQHGLVVLVGQLPGNRREQEIGKHEQGKASLHEKRCVPSMSHRQIEGDENGDAVPQAVVVERADCLSDEERQEIARRQDRKL
jgi:hypothetical protein